MSNVDKAKLVLVDALTQVCRELDDISFRTREGFASDTRNTAYAQLTLAKKWHASLLTVAETLDLDTYPYKRKY